MYSLVAQMNSPDQPLTNRSHYPHRPSPSESPAPAPWAKDPSAAGLSQSEDSTHSADSMLGIAKGVVITLLGSEG